MRKVSIVTVLLVSAVFAVAPCFATPTADMVLGARKIYEYGRHFLNNNGSSVTTRFLRVAPAENVEALSGLGGDPRLLDTPLEIALLSRATGVTQIRPVEATQVISDRELDLVLGAFLLKEIAVLRFLGNTSAVGIREGILEHNILAHGNVSRADIDAYYHSQNGVRALVAEQVNEEFNRISFMLDNTRSFSYMSHNATLTLNPQNRHYTLSYASPYTNNETRTITGNSLGTLSSAMLRSGDFDQTGARNLEAYAALIPAVVYANWQNIGVTNGVCGRTLVIDTITNFLTNPSDTTFIAMFGIQLRYEALLDERFTGLTRDVFADIALRSYRNVISGLNPGLLARIDAERRFNVTMAHRVPDNSDFGVFSTPFSAGGRQ